MLRRVVKLSSHTGGVWRALRSRRIRCLTTFVSVFRYLTLVRHRSGNHIELLRRIVKCSFTNG